ncbi:MAG: Fic family protein [Spirosomataceae bacterium]
MSKRIELSILTWEHLPTYISKQPLTLHKHIARLRRIEPSLDFFSFLVASSIFSSQIEGSSVEFNDYYRYQELGLKRTKPIKEIDDLIKAYQYARKNPITEKRILTAHKYLSATLLSTNHAYQGAYRDKDVTVRNTQTGQVVYRGAPASIVRQEMERLVADIVALTNQDLTHNEIFYFAAQIHLRISEIHPFADGNGRMARLLEKWFLSQLLGDVAWYIQSERNYQRRIVSYYRKIHLGKSYDSLRDELSVPFLLMLPWSLRLKAV